MSKSNAFEADLIALIFNGTPIANIADNAASSPLTSIYVALHTGDPGETGDQTTSECAYTSYARVAVDRDGTGWTITDNAATNAALISFPACTGGSETVTHVSVGTAASGAGKVLYKSAVSASLVVSSGITPKFEAGNLTLQEN